MEKRTGCKPDEIPVKGHCIKKSDILSDARRHIYDVMEDYNEDFEIVGMAVIGSRVEGKHRPDSDIDVVVEYRGDVREDHAFNILNNSNPAEYDIPRLKILGIPIDINPIKPEKSGVLKDFLRTSEKYWDKDYWKDKTSKDNEDEVKRMARYDEIIREDYEERM
jgi:predicted nucleotidyltransferase